MPMVKREPLGELCTLQEEMTRLFERSVKAINADPPVKGEWQPPVDIFEEDGEIVLKMDVPGVREEELGVRVEDGRLIVEGERRFARETPSRHYQRIECSYGPFSRAFSLPPHLDEERIHASCKEGVLTIVLSLKGNLPRKEIEATHKEG